MKSMNRRSALKMVAAATASLSPDKFSLGAPQVKSSSVRPNILCLMVDQQRFDTIAALGNRTIYTPNLDRLVARGITFRNAYAPCPVCVPSRYSIRTGCAPPTTAIYGNELARPAPHQAATMSGRCGPYLAQTMKTLGYRTFGVGKFHTMPWDEELGYDVHLHSEELYGNPDQRRGDSYASWIATRHPEFNFIEHLVGERTEMYYMPQMSPMPASVTVEGWAATQAIAQIGRRDNQPYFGFVSFVGPHPPFAPPIPFNRLYDPDRMPDPIGGSLENDFLDEQLPWMNYAIWAEDIAAPHARVLKARYYGEITYIDSCIGRILDAVEQRGDAENTVICFFADHGDHLGDHHAWQKESYFEASCHVPFLVSWPARLPAGQVRDDLASHTDIFGVVTGAAGHQQLREGIDLLGLASGTPQHRTDFFGYYSHPGSRQFKVMVRSGDWKYIFMANGSREQLFDVRDDPNELTNLAESRREIKQQMYGKAVGACLRPELSAAMDGHDLRKFPFEARPVRRIHQFDQSRGVRGFPNNPEDVLNDGNS
jgi:arylsulfatase